MELSRAFAGRVASKLHPCVYRQENKGGSNWPTDMKAHAKTLSKDLQLQRGNAST